MGFKLDKNADLFPEGLYLFEVADATIGYSKKSGDAYLKVTLRDVNTRRTLFENWMIEGNGQGMTVPKLKALEIDLDQDVEPGDLIGRRMIARVKHRESEQYGTQAQIAKSWPESAPPKEWAAVNPAIVDTEPMPFDGDKSAPSKPAASQSDDVPF